MLAQDTARRAPTQVFAVQSSGISGNVISREQTPTRQNMIAAGLSGLITNSLTEEFRIVARGGAQSILSEPVDVDTQLAHKQADDIGN